jgi:hypothetical protein
MLYTHPAKAVTAAVRRLAIACSKIPIIDPYDETRSLAYL